MTTSRGGFGQPLQHCNCAAAPLAVPLFIHMHTHAYLCHASPAYVSSKKETLVGQGRQQNYSCRASKVFRSALARPLFSHAATPTATRHGTDSASEPSRPPGVGRRRRRHTRLLSAFFPQQCGDRTGIHKLRRLSEWHRHWLQQRQESQLQASLLDAL